MKLTLGAILKVTFDDPRHKALRCDGLKVGFNGARRKEDVHYSVDVEE